MSTQANQTISPAVPSATVVLLREVEQQLEVLMLRKSKSLNYGGSWVFPGGVFDAEDYLHAESELGDQSIENVAKIAACRETQEESGLVLEPESLSAFAHWTTPEMLARRYAAWFLIADVRQIDTPVKIDHGEIDEYRWFKPKQAIEQQAQGEIRLNGPSFVTLTQMAQLQTVDNTLKQYRDQAVEYFKPRGFASDDGFTSLYEDDSDYHLESLPSQTASKTTKNTSGREHRLYMYKRQPWRYVKS